MQNSQGPKFINSVKRKNLKPYEYFLEESEPRQSPNFDGYVLIRRFVEATPIVGYLVQKLGLRWTKTKDMD